MPGERGQVFHQTACRLPLNRHMGHHDEHDAVDIMLPQDLFHYADIEGEIEDIPKVQRISQPDDAGAAAALSFIENVAIQRRKAKAVTCANVGG